MWGWCGHSASWSLQNKNSMLCCYGLPIISSLSTSSTGVIFVSASTGFGNVSILSASIWASSIGDSPNSPKTYSFFFIKITFFKILFSFPFPFVCSKKLFLHLHTGILCIPCVKLNTWPSRVFSRFVSIFTLNQHRIRWNVDDNTNVWRWWNLQMNFAMEWKQVNFEAACKFHTGTYA